MSLYIPNTYLFEYAEDMRKILAYLNENGILLISARKVKEYYERFSSDCYCAGWMDCDSPNVLENFAEWLAEQED